MDREPGTVERAAAGAPAPDADSTENGRATRRCRHFGDDGRPCGAPSEFVDPGTGWCFAHDPGKAAERRAAQRLGGARTAAKHGRGLDPDDLGDLLTPQDAQRWAAEAARAVATGRMSASQATALRGLLAEFLRAHQAGEVQERLDELAARLDRTGAGRRRGR